MFVAMKICIRGDDSSVYPVQSSDVGHAVTEKQFGSLHPH